MPSAGHENAPLREQRGDGEKAGVDEPRAQHSTSERPFIHRFRSGIFKADLPASMKIVLLVLAEFANAGGGSCYPSITSIAKLAHLNERTVRRLLEKDSPWQARIGQEGKGRHWRTYEYQLRIPEGADTTPARWESGADTTPARWESRCGHSQPEVRTLSAEGADTTPADVGLDVGKSRLGEKQQLSSSAAPNDQQAGEDLSGGQTAGEPEPLALTNPPASREAPADLNARKAERLAQVTDEAITAWNASPLVKANGGLLAAVSTTVGRKKRQQQVLRCLQTAREICAEAYGSQRVTAEFWGDYFAEAAADDFTAGRSKRGAGHEQWLADFEYLTRAATMLKIYDRSASEHVA